MVNVTDLTCILMLMEPQKYPLAVLYLAKIIYQVFYHSAPICFFLWMYYGTQTEKNSYSKKQQIIIGIPYLFSLLMIFTTVFTHAILYFDEQKVYHHGKLIFILYGEAAFYLIFGVIRVIKNRKVMTPTTRRTIYFYSLLCLLGVIVQVIKPAWRITGFALVVSVLLGYFTLDNPSDYIDKELNLMNRKGLLTNLNRMAFTDNHLELISLKIEGLKNIREVLGRENQIILLQNIVEYLESSFGYKSLYRIADDIFVAQLEVDHEQRLRQLLELQKRFKESFKCGNNDIKVDILINVTVMAMVFGNMGDTSGTGVAFSRDPSTGENHFMAEYLINAQGEDVVAGIRTPMDISALEKQQPKIFKQITTIRNRLEKHYHDMQDMEFTVQEGKLFMLQCRNGKRTGPAAVKMAVDMVAEKLITKEQALLRVKPDQLDQLLHPQFDAKALKAAKALAEGLNASPGAGCGQIVFTAEEAVEMDKAGKKVILVRKETSPDDIAGMYVAQGILTSTGGRTSHAAVVARGMGTPCVCGCAAVVFSGKDAVTIGGKSFKKGDFISIDGSTGKVYGETIPVTPANVSGDLETFLGWADEIRAKSKRVTPSGKTVKGFDVLANAEQNEAAIAFRFGAAGIGLCRTEHMFFEEPKLTSFQKMIISDTTEERKENLKAILPYQEKDFYGIIKAMEGRAVTIRLLDPPLNEFVQAETPELAKALAKKLGVKPSVIDKKYAELNEHNPMLGHRGCRLAITYPEIYETQVEAIARATAKAEKDGLAHDVRIMIPNVTTFQELKQRR